MHQTLSNRSTRALVALAAALFGLAQPLAAQETGSVGGQVVDARTLQPIASTQVFIPTLIIKRDTVEEFTKKIEQLRGR